MMYGGDDWMWGGWILMTLAMVVFWALVITAIVLAIPLSDWWQPPEPGQSQIRSGGRRRYYYAR
jgi:uncharacterized membrane protein